MTVRDAILGGGDDVLSDKARRHQTGQHWRAVRAGGFGWFPIDAGKGGREGFNYTTGDGD